MNTTILPVILCGGSGTRLWPLSRSHEPKQLQTLFGNKSLLTHTALRMHEHPDCQPPLIVCSQTYAGEVESQLRDNNVPISAILEEPIGRDTAAAAGIAAYWAQQQFGENAIIVLLPADHYIEDVSAFHNAISAAAHTAAEGFICTIGVKPDRPETGYGYIRRHTQQVTNQSSYHVDTFVEKPHLELAQSYVESGDYVWNAGIFAVSASFYLTELERFAADIHAKLLTACQSAKMNASSTGSVRFTYDSALFSDIPKKSIDYAIMEHTTKAAVLPAEFGWSDVGNWSSVRDLSECDENGNNLTGDVRAFDSSNCLVQAGHRVVALVGLKDIAVIDTPDALLICANDQAQEVKKVHQALEKEGHAAALRHGSDTPTFDARVCGWARNWLFNTALPLWADVGMDQTYGGAFEALNLSGDPITDVPKRFRVQARQAYTFAYAHSLGWTAGASAMESAFDFMLRHCWRDQGGWGHTFNRDGSPHDTSVDTYDQAFGLLALAWGYKVTGDSKMLHAAYATMNYLYTSLRHPERGFIEGSPARTARRANPHMHLFEAAMQWMELHQDARMAELAKEIFDLYKTHFCIDGLLREYFNDDLTLISTPSSPEELMVEPGHLLEWSYLLHQYRRLTGEDTPTTATLEAFADAFGVSPITGLVMDHCAVSGARPDQVTSRLWPQTEYIRQKLNRRDAVERRKALEMLERLKSNFLQVNDNITGAWHDRVDGEGKLLSSTSPASSFYHIIGCLSPLVS